MPLLRGTATRFLRLLQEEWHHTRLGRLIIGLPEPVFQAAGGLLAGGILRCFGHRLTRLPRRGGTVIITLNLRIVNRKILIL